MALLMLPNGVEKLVEKIGLLPYVKEYNGCGREILRGRETRSEPVIKSQNLMI